ncbi:hypothetical protein BBO99_00009507 [Phytophthora kernoviae]|uniref:HIG1 domain-containing protein n=2 Tax=Phytophthora kernoviae TaxID=325452 RepID=A0A3R7GAY6_9STRA|nr:hypothetical protein G195_011510 [Phytophthora kernoviae 00238/432]KAG2502705.1 hypothetical protein JM16_009668 [Phytophthora kernoviae]KAG2502999.1 hypothetical protein JM18_009690 [Phytophthora kernoviae]RLN45005.1 hypothetical protein BBI17_009549 [Phytophthora kernoviae]RLN73223.1 hypothetical protein BBO99_00009507 [Phytophthora kernoviae]
MHKPAHDFEVAKRQRDIISWDASVSGFKAVSGKWAFVVAAYLAGFVVVSESRLLAGARNPEQYLNSMDPNFVEVRMTKSKLPLHKRLANQVYDHPYQTLAMTGAPLVGGIFAYQTTNHGIARSQQIMHTRIYGQAAVVLLLLGSMAFNDYMRKRGRFEEDEGEDRAKIEEITA